MLPAASFAAQLTVVVPMGNAVPDAGTHVIVTPGQLSVAVGAKFTTAVHLAGSVSFVMSPGQAIFGASLSLTVTVNEQLSLLPAASVATDLTVVVPLGNVEPDAGVETTVTPGQLSLAVTVKLTTAEH